MLSIIANQMVPFIERCVLIIFPLDQLQKSYGLSQTDTLKLKDTMRLDYKKLLESVIDLIPALPTPPPIQVVNPPILEEEKVEKDEHPIDSSDSNNLKPDIVVDQDTKEEDIPKAKFEIGVSDDSHNEENSSQLTNADEDLDNSKAGETQQIDKSEQVLADEEQKLG